jgi:hypothetical protein
VGVALAMGAEAVPELQAALAVLEVVIRRLAMSDDTIDKIAFGRLQVARWAIGETVDLLDPKDGE